MRHIPVLICRVDDRASDAMTDLASLGLPVADAAALPSETALNDLEATIHMTGAAILRRLHRAKWERIDAKPAARYRRSFLSLRWSSPTDMTRSRRPAASACRA